jgi:hypothetical protein
MYKFFYYTNITRFNTYSAAHLSVILFETCDGKAVCKKDIPMKFVKCIETVNPFLRIFIEVWDEKRSNLQNTNLMHTSKDRSAML